MTLKEAGLRDHIPFQCRQAYLYEKQIVITYTESITALNHYNYVEGQANAWIAFPVSMLRAETANEVGIPTSCYHAGELPRNIRDSARKIPVIVLPNAKSFNEAKTVLNKETIAVVVPNVCSRSAGQFCMYIRFTDDNGKPIVMLASCPAVRARNLRVIFS